MWAFKILYTSIVSAEGAYFENSKQSKSVAKSYNIYAAKRRVNEAGEVKKNKIDLSNELVFYITWLFSTRRTCVALIIFPLQCFNSNNDTITDCAKSKVINVKLFFYN